MEALDEEVMEEYYIEEMSIVFKLGLIVKHSVLTMLWSPLDFDHHSL